MRCWCWPPTTTSRASRRFVCSFVSFQGSILFHMNAASAGNNVAQPTHTLAAAIVFAAFVARIHSVSVLADAHNRFWGSVFLERIGLVFVRAGGRVAVLLVSAKTGRLHRLASLAILKQASRSSPPEPVMKDKNLCSFEEVGVPPGGGERAHC